MNERYAASAVLKKVLETAIAPDLLDQLQAETNFTPATSESQIHRIQSLLDIIYKMAEEKGSEHPDSLDLCQELVNMYEETCQFQCAEKLLLRLQIAFQRTYGRENIMMCKVWIRLAEILMHEVHYPEAETYYLKSLVLIEVYYPLPERPLPHRHASHRFSQQYANTNAFHVARSNVGDIGNESSENKTEVKEADDSKRDEKKSNDDMKEFENKDSFANDESNNKINYDSISESKVITDDGPTHKVDESKTEGTEDPLVELYRTYIPVLRGLAEIYWHLQRLSESERYYRRVLPMLFYNHGIHHQATLSAINGLALVLEADGRAAEALELCEQSLQDCISLLGPKDPITQTAVSTVARLKETLNMFQEAEAMYRLAITYSTDALGDCHPQTLNLQVMLSRLLQKTKQYMASLIVLQDLAPKFEELYGTYHMDYLEVVFMQGEMCVFLDDFQQARDYYLKCYNHRCLLLRTRHHPLCYQAKFALGKTYHMACSWRHDIALFRQNQLTAKTLLTEAFYGTIAVYGQAPINKPLILLPANGDSANQASDTTEINEDTNNMGGSSDSGDNNSHTKSNSGAHPPPIKANTRASIGLESLLDAKCDGDNVDFIYQQRGVFRADCIDLALYLGSFYLEYDYYHEADSLFRLLFDVLRLEKMRSPEQWNRCFTLPIQARIHYHYGQLLEHKKQYARAVTILETSVTLYKQVTQQTQQQIIALEKEIGQIQQDLDDYYKTYPSNSRDRGNNADYQPFQPNHVDDNGNTGDGNSDPLEITLKKMLLVSKQDMCQQAQQQAVSMQQATEDAEEQLLYANSLYTLAS